jgi:carbamoyltransferase
MITLGLFMQGPNTGACLVREGRVVAAAEEERFTRQKRASEAFPARAIRFCLQHARVSLRDVDVVATGWDHSKYPGYMDAHMRGIPDREQDPLADRMEGLAHTKLAPDVAQFRIQVGLHKIDPGATPQIRWYGHHRCHVASTHYVSGFDRSAVLVIDGSGEEVATSTWMGEGASLEQVEQWTLPHSLGWFYASMTEWLGFSAYSGEGKVMGLAAYGDPNPDVATRLRRFCQPDAERVYRIDPRFVYYGPRSYSKQFTDHLVDLLGPPRTPESEITDYATSVAYETQQRLEEVAIALTERLLEQTGEQRLCISGGVAMNCKMNGVLSNLPGVEAVFINPAAARRWGRRFWQHRRAATTPGKKCSHTRTGGPASRMTPSKRPCSTAIWTTKDATTSPRRPPTCSRKARSWDGFRGGPS